MFKPIHQGRPRIVKRLPSNSPETKKIPGMVFQTSRNLLFLAILKIKDH